jgi:RimJ/RimL family protein N-acetyltransferase
MLKIREVRESDLERLREIINEPAVIRYMPLERPVRLSRIRRWFQSFYLFRQPAIFVLDIGKVIGACTISDNGKITIWVDEGHQRKGYGRKAMAHLREYAGKKGMERLWLECFKDNRQALSFYRSLGFIHIGERNGEYVMELKI